MTFLLFFFNDTATTEIYTLSLHDALPISIREIFYRMADRDVERRLLYVEPDPERFRPDDDPREPGFLQQISDRSEEHTSELQSRQYLVCRLLLEKKNITATTYSTLQTLPQ